MNKEEFIQKFAEQLEDTDCNTLTFETKFRELDAWNSLVALSVIAMIDEEYDVVLKGNDMASAITLGDLYNVVRRKL